MSVSTMSSEGHISFEEFKKSVIHDFRLANISRQASLMGRKEVLTGKVVEGKKYELKVDNENVVIQKKGR